MKKRKSQLLGIPRVFVWTTELNVMKLICILKGFFMFLEFFIEEAIQYLRRNITI